MQIVSLWILLGLAEVIWSTPFDLSLSKMAESVSNTRLLESLTPNENKNQSDFLLWKFFNASFRQPLYGSWNFINTNNSLDTVISY